MAYAKKGMLKNTDNLYAEVSLIKGKALFIWIKVADAEEKDVDTIIKERGVQ